MFIMGGVGPNLRAIAFDPTHSWDDNVYGVAHLSRRLLLPADQPLNTGEYSGLSPFV
jgi:hypothetical protein